MASARTESPSHSPPPLALGVCTFNRGPRIVETLEAICRMDRVEGRVGGRLARVIVIDNNSTDDTGRIVDEFARDRAQLPIVRIVETVQGSSAARARFVREAMEPYIALLDDDVIPDAGWAAAVIGVLDDHADAGWVGGKVELAWESGPSALARRCKTMLAHQDFGEEARAIERIDRGLVSAAFAARREALLAIGWLEHRMLAGREGGELECGEDYEMCVRLRLGGWKVWYTPRASVKHLIPAKRQTAEYLAKLARGVSLSKAQLKWLSEGKPGVEWAMRHLAHARRKLARTRVLEWRPSIRMLKLAEHEGRVESWERLVAALGK